MISWLSQNKFKLAIILILLTGSFLVMAGASAQFGFEYATGLELGTKDIRITVFEIINVVLGFLGIVALGVMLYGGYVWMGAGGVRSA